MQLHTKDTPVVLEEGNHPLPRFPKCDIFVTCTAVNGKQQVTEMCNNGEEHKIKRLREEESQASTSVFQAYRRPLLTVTEFKFLGWVLNAYDDKCPEVFVNLQKDLIK